MPPIVRLMALALPLGLAPLVAAAQPQTAASAPPASSAAPPKEADAAESSSAVPAKPVIPATGYSYGGPSSFGGASSPPAAPATGSTTGAPRADRPQPRTARSNPSGTDAIMAGFEMHSDGSTRLFVQLSKPAAYDTKAVGSTLTYVLKGTRVDRRNNENPLVTVHFNTPVTSARLVPHGRDVWFVLDLRASVQPTATMGGAKDGAAVLQVDFPKGDYLPASPESAPADPATSQGSNASAPSATAKPLHVASTRPAVKPAPPSAD